MFVCVCAERDPPEAAGDQPAGHGCHLGRAFCPAGDWRSELWDVLSAFFFSLSASVLLYRAPRGTWAKAFSSTSLWCTDSMLCARDTFCWAVETGKQSVCTCPLSGSVVLRLGTHYRLQLCCHPAVVQLLNFTPIYEMLCDLGTFPSAFFLFLKSLLVQDKLLFFTLS